MGRSNPKRYNKKKENITPNSYPLQITLAALALLLIKEKKEQTL